MPKTLPQIFSASRRITHNSGPTALMSTPHKHQCSISQSNIVRHTQPLHGVHTFDHRSKRTVDWPAVHTKWILRVCGLDAVGLRPYDQTQIPFLSEAKSWYCKKQPNQRIVLPRGSHARVTIRKSACWPSTLPKSVLCRRELCRHNTHRKKATGVSDAMTFSMKR